jgi:hypothetical protein
VSHHIYGPEFRILSVGARYLSIPEAQEKFVSEFIDDRHWAPSDIVRDFVWFAGLMVFLLNARSFTNPTNSSYAHKQPYRHDHVLHGRAET